MVKRKSRRKQNENSKKTAHYLAIGVALIEAYSDSVGRSFCENIEKIKVKQTLLDRRWRPYQSVVNGPLKGALDPTISPILSTRRTRTNIIKKSGR
jgi:hypothetical protein